MQLPPPPPAGQCCCVPFVLLLPKEHAPVHHESLAVPFHFGNSSPRWFCKGCRTAAGKGAEAVRPVLLLSQGGRGKLTPETSVAATAGFHGIAQTGNKCGCSDRVSQTAFPMLSGKSLVEAFTGFRLAGSWGHMLEPFR